MTANKIIMMVLLFVLGSALVYAGEIKIDFGSIEAKNVEENQKCTVTYSGNIAGTYSGTCMKVDSCTNKNGFDFLMGNCATNLVCCVGAQPKLADDKDKAKQQSDASCTAAYNAWKKTTGTKVDAACYSTSIIESTYRSSNCIDYFEGNQICPSDQVCCKKDSNFDKKEEEKKAIESIKACTGEITDGDNKLTYTGTCVAKGSCYQKANINGKYYDVVQSECSTQEVCCQESNEDKSNCAKKCLNLGCKEYSIIEGDCKCKAGLKEDTTGETSDFYNPDYKISKDSNSKFGCVYDKTKTNTYCDVSCIDEYGTPHEFGWRKTSPLFFTVECNKKGPTDKVCNNRVGCFAWNDEDCWSTKNMGYVIGSALQKAWMKTEWYKDMTKFLKSISDKINPDRWRETACNPYNSGILRLNRDNGAGGIYLADGSTIGWFGAERAKNNDTHYIYTITWALSGLKEDNKYKITLDGIKAFPSRQGDQWYELNQSQTHSGKETTKLFASRKAFSKICLVFEEEPEFNDGTIGEESYCRNIADEERNFTPVQKAAQQGNNGNGHNNVPSDGEGPSCEITGDC